MGKYKDMHIDIWIDMWTNMRILMCMHMNRYLDTHVYRARAPIRVVGCCSPAIVSDADAVVKCTIRHLLVPASTHQSCHKNTKVT